MDELRERCRQHFTAGELADFLGIGVGELFDAFPELIEINYKELVEETCFEFDDDET